MPPIEDCTEVPGTAQARPRGVPEDLSDAVGSGVPHFVQCTAIFMRHDRLNKATLKRLDTRQRFGLQAVLGVGQPAISCVGERRMERASSPWSMRASSPDSTPPPAPETATGTTPFPRPSVMMRLGVGEQLCQASSRSLVRGTRGRGARRYAPWYVMLSCCWLW